MVKLVLDAMGGDGAPYTTVAGAVKAVNSDGEMFVYLTGRKEELQAELLKYKYDKDRIEIVDCRDSIGMNDNPAEAIRRKDSSLIVAYNMLKDDNDICALVTAGSTGATIVAGQLILKNIDGIKRAALCPAIPNVRGGDTLLIDCGANAECRPEMLCQFAVLGSAFAKAGLGAENPRIGLLNNGTESHKGTHLQQETFGLLKNLKDVNFVGNVEGRDIMMGDCDVVVCDGFTGNIALKSIEGCGKMFLSVMKREFSSSLSSKIGYLFLRKAVKRMRKQLDFDKFGGALLLGLRKPVIKTHGSSKPETVAKALAHAADIHRSGFIPSVEKALKNNAGNADEI